MSAIAVRPVEGLGEVVPGDDLAVLLRAATGPLLPDEVIVMAHKIVSKAEGAVVDLAGIVPSPRATEIAAQYEKDPRVVQVVLDESAELVRVDRGVLICRTHHGFVCANAGVDASNAGAAGRVITLPRDPDQSARDLRAALPGHPAVVISDSFGRAWRHGQCDVAIGIAGLEPLDDWRGRHDADRAPLRATWIAIADQAAAAADLVRTKDARVPAAVISGLGQFVTAADGPGAAALVRPRAEDLFS